MNKDRTKARRSISDRVQLIAIEAPPTGAHALRADTPEDRRVAAIVAKVRGAK